MQSSGYLTVHKGTPHCVQRPQQFEIVGIGWNVESLAGTLIRYTRSKWQP